MQRTDDLTMFKLCVYSLLLQSCARQCSASIASNAAGTSGLLAWSQKKSGVKRPLQSHQGTKDGIEESGTKDDVWLSHLCANVQKAGDTARRRTKGAVEAICRTVGDARRMVVMEVSGSSNVDDAYSSYTADVDGYDYEKTEDSTWARLLDFENDGTDAANIEGPRRLGGSDPRPWVRGLKFWSRASAIYFSYKKMELECHLKVRGPEAQEQAWEDLHELNSERMLDMCLELRGFYIKFGQFLGTRHDFLPPQYTSKLGRLHDEVPGMPPSQVKQLIEEGLGLEIPEYFSYLNLTHPVGSASISQVHEGRLLSNGNRVAVKVQYPDAQEVMMGDLSNLRKLAAFLSGRELKFDMVSPVEEMTRQISHEFDFIQEANNMDSMRETLQKAVPSVTLPKTVLASRRVLVMTFVEGVPFTQLVIPTGLTKRLFARRGKKILDTLADAWGHMLFDTGVFNADPHPGNLLLMPGMRVGLLDWGQCKTISRDTQLKLAHLMKAMDATEKKCRTQDSYDDEIARRFLSLGIKVDRPDHSSSIAKIALSMFETADIEGIVFSPFSSNNALSENSVSDFPPDLFFLLRSVQMLRGLSHAMGVPFSLSHAWRGYVDGALAGKMGGGSAA